MTDVKLSTVTKRFGEVTAVDGFDLEVASGESIVLLGPSGCGKTTLLRMIAGFEQPTEGAIRIGGSVVSGEGRFVPPDRRGLGMVFQSYALWPHMTVASNVAFGLTTRGRKRTRRMTKTEVSDAVDTALAKVQLPGFRDRYPHEISGGQQQRVALARALVVNPKVLLLDEPLSNLDTLLREEMRNEIRRIQQESGITMIYITHDRSEALGIADRIVSLRSGQVQQVGSPVELYRRPVSTFVAEALGPVNVISTRRRSDAPGHVELPTGQVLRAMTPEALGSQGDPRPRVTIRPHDVLVQAAPLGESHGKVIDAVFLGDEVDYTVALHESDEKVRAFARTTEPFSPGKPVRLEVTASEANVLIADGSARDATAGHADRAEKVTEAV